MISIALASYNGEKYIREQLDSILSQTIQDFEVVVCDDASIDNTWSILEEYTEKDSRFRIYKNKENLGFKKNFEKAISLCKGNYIALSDQDDVWKERHLEVLYNSIGNKCGVLGNALMVDNDLNSLNKTHIEYIGGNSNYITSIDVMLLRVIYVGNFCQGASMMFKSSFLKSIIPVPEIFEVHDIWFALAAILKKSFVFNPEIITLYRQHNSNVIKRNKKPVEFANNTNKTDKLLHIEYAKNNLMIDNTVLNIINEAIKYHKNKHKFSFRIGFFKKWSLQYESMYLTNKNKLFRTIKYLTLG